MRRLLLSACVAAFAAFPAAAQSIGGSYSVAGTNLDGSNYTGTVEITLTSDTTCEIVWETGGTGSNGICSRNDDSFAAAYVMGKAVGLVIYKVQDNGTLDGLWTIAGKEAPARKC